MMTIFLLIGKLLASDDPVESVRTQCLENRNWPTEKCEMVNVAPDADYYQSNMALDVVAATIANTIYVTTEMGALEYKINHPYIFPGKKNGAQIRTAVISELKEATRSQHLNECQKACLVKCASAHILDYESNLRTKFGPIDSAYEQGTGVCTEFQKVADDIGWELGVPTRYAFGWRHAFNWFYINGHWVLGEPQTDSCRFFSRDQLGESELKDITLELNGALK